VACVVNKNYEDTSEVIVS